MTDYARGTAAARADRVPKTKFTRWEALAKAEEHPSYQAYRCAGCGHWHVGEAAKEAQR